MPDDHGRSAPESGLGRTQVLVLNLLADQPKNVRTLSRDWPGLTEAMVTGALDRLASRGLVDRRSPHGFYEWHLTDKGAYVERELVRKHGTTDEDLDEEAAQYE